MSFVAGLDEDQDGWPEGLGNVERPGMGQEKLDNAVYTIRGYADLAEMARAKLRHDSNREGGPRESNRALKLIDKFEQDWVVRRRHPRGYADSLEDPGNEKVFQRHWIGLTPTDAVLPASAAAGPPAPLASGAHAHGDPDRARADLLHRPARAVPHRHRADLGARPGNPGASCDSVVSTRAQRAKRLHPQHAPSPR